MKEKQEHKPEGGGGGIESIAHADEIKRDWKKFVIIMTILVVMAILATLEVLTK